MITITLDTFFRILAPEHYFSLYLMPDNMFGGNAGCIWEGMQTALIPNVDDHLLRESNKNSAPKDDKLF